YRLADLEPLADQGGGLGLVCLGRIGDRLVTALGKPLGEIGIAHDLGDRITDGAPQPNRRVGWRMQAQTLVTSASGRPASVKVGTSGSEGSRCEPVTAMARTLPDFT